MSSTAMTYGNLALSIEGIEPVDPRPHFEVVDGGYAVSWDYRGLGSAPSQRTMRPLVISVAISAVLVLTLFGLFLYGEISAQWAYDSAVAATVQEEFSVRAGDTLWSIAEEHPIPGLNTADTVSVISEWNNLDGGCLHVGECLLVPAAS